MSDSKSESRGDFHELEGLYLWAGSIKRDATMQNFPRAVLEKQLKDFLKQCKQFGLINYSTSFFIPEISEKNLISALGSISEKLKSLIISEAEFSTLKAA